MVVVVVYIPPWYNGQQTRSIYTHTNDTLMVLSNKYENPYVFIGGDFNRKSMSEATRDFPDIKIIPAGPTRNGSTLDILASNFNCQLIDQGTVDPISSDAGVESDHRTVFASFRMPRVPSYRVEEYSYNHISEEGDRRFEAWIRNQDWSLIKNSGQHPDEQVEILHAVFKKGMDQAYPVKRRKKKDSEPPWMTDWIRDLIEDRRKVFKTDRGRSLSLIHI